MLATDLIDPSDICDCCGKLMIDCDCCEAAEVEGENDASP